ncbi:hypothetical protein DH2020_020752 [Rehmannia glutinosa]|uniref:Nonsense-mediated mRNA decay factor SMG8 n=1 Tax=Rehmannia glutinosa TaxID=99300 RepID=A0ABR0W3N8_REHGL
MLKKFRILQAAKHTMAPFVRSQSTPPANSRARSSTHSRVSIPGASPKNPSPGKSRGILNRNASAITVGSYTSLLPGQCTPVVLFVFLDDFNEIHPSGNMEEPSETSSLHSSSRAGLPTKGSGSVVVLARPANKSEGGLRKKLQSSLEAQIRFSIKKCRTLSGLESSHAGSRSGGAITGSSPLFSLDASKAVSLVDACSCQSGESLEFAIGLVDEVLDGKATPDSLLLESHQQNVNKEDILSVKEFIYRQSDLLRGRGGLVANSNSGSAGVGMFAAAAAAAAASAGKTITALSSQLSRSGENEATSSDSFESAVSHLDSGVGLNTRFSTMWCQKPFQLRRRMNARSIWISGRQLCDAVSLTGKPCMHQRHDTESLSADEIKSHSSGFVYLHACACGRSRRIRPDPFDYETANVTYNTFADCDKFLPAVQLPEGSIEGPIRPSSWNLIRVGGARYYDPSKGLLQSGFCTTQKFLLKWTILLEKLKEVNHSLLNESQKVSSDRNINVETVVDADSQASDAAWLGSGRTQNGVGIKVSLSSNIIGNSSNNGSVGRGSSNFTMRKPFSEVVAGPAAVNSGFPPLLSRKQPIPDAEKGVMLHHARNRGLDKQGETVENQESRIAVVDKTLNNGIAGDIGDPFPHISSKVVPLNMNDSEQTKAASSMKHVTIYVGFEHECPHGHRFILTQDHLSELGSAYSVPEDNIVPLSVENSDKKPDPTKLGKSGGHGRSRRQSNGLIMGGANGKAKNLEKSKEKLANGNMYSNKSMKSTRQGRDQNERTKVTDFVKDLDSDAKSTTVDDGGCAFSLLKRSLPIYMSCPHCRDSSTKNDASNVKFASTISQLQRIFVVTPSFPILLAADPIIQFELSCLPPSIPDRERKLQFSLGCPVILPPESFLSLRLPFVYGVELEDGSLHSLKPFENQPQLTAYIVKGTTLRVVSNTNNLDPASVT